MLNPRIRGALVVLAASAGLAGCTNLGPYGGVGVGVGVGSGSPYGYGTYGYDPYYAGYGYGSGYGSEFGYNPYGWYNGYYYPGSGYWVYDRDRNRRTLTDAERAYWRERAIAAIRARRGLHAPTSTTAAKENWSGFERPSAANSAATATTDRAQARAQVRQRALEQRAQRQQAAAQAERQEARSSRQEIRQRAIGERSESRRVRRDAPDE